MIRWGTHACGLALADVRGEGLVAWTYEGEGLLALATRGDADLRRILDWWEATARLLRP